MGTAQLGTLLRHIHKLAGGDRIRQRTDRELLDDFVSRRDEAFWRDARGVPLPDTLRESLALYEETGRIQSARLQLFQEPNYFFILAGSGRLPRRPIVEADLAPTGEIRHVFERIRAQNREFVARMPAHGTYLAELHRRAS